jgi:HD-GYP domain-containing protein (c-di-GMP phosphodiesterase class II)
MTPQLGTDGTRIVYPFRGIAQAFRRSGSHPHRRTLVYVAALVGAALLTACALVVAGYTLETPLVVAALAVAAAVAERISVRFAVAQRGLTKTAEQSISLLPTLFAAVLFGPLAAACVGAASMLGDPELTSARDRDRAPRLKWATYTSTRFLGGAAMGIAAQATLTLVPSDFGQLIAATLVGAIVGEALDVLFTSVTAKVRGRPILDAVRTVAPVVLISAPIYAPIVALLAFMYVRVSPWTLALFLVPAMAAQRLYGLYQEERRLAVDLSTANETLKSANLQFAATLIATLDARDRYTAGHSAAVAIYSRDIAERMGLSVEVQEHTYLCGLVHDIGKIGLPPGLLEKPGALTLEERRQMQEHSAIGESILGHVDVYSEIATVVRHHHERIDGQGYPDGLVDEAIPLVSRIIAVADAYNAMTSDRPYRDAMPSRVARLRLAQAVDSQFDTAVVAAFEAILAGALEDYRVGKRRDFLEFAQSAQESVPESTPSIAEVA